LQVHKLGGAQAVPIGDKNHQRVAVTVPIPLGGADQALDFGFGQVLARA
jgi:hypothetical protein